MNKLVKSLKFTNLLSKKLKTYKNVIVFCFNLNIYLCFNRVVE